MNTSDLWSSKIYSMRQFSTNITPSIGLKELQIIQHSKKPKLSYIKDHNINLVQLWIDHIQNSNNVIIIK